MATKARASYGQLWRREVTDEERLRFINPDDLPKEDILKSLGLGHSTLSGSFGITDAAEIRRRQALCNLMLQNPIIQDYLLHGSSHDLPSGLPTSGNEFLRYYNAERSHNPYWTSVHHFLGLMDTTTAMQPDVLQGMIKEVRAGLTLEERERAMATEITKRLENVTVLEGMMSFEIGEMTPVPDPDNPSRLQLDRMQVDYMKLVDSSVHGHSEFSARLERSRSAELPSYAQNGWNPFGWPVRLHQAYLDTVVMRRAYRAMVISQADSALVEDVAEAIKVQLDLMAFETSMTGAIVDVYVYYTHDGLEIQFLDISRRSDISQTLRRGMTAGFDGYTSAQRRAIDKARRKMNKKMAELHDSIQTDRWRSDLESRSPGIFTRRQAVAAPRTDATYKWFAINNLYQSPKYQALVGELNKHRERLGDLLYQLSAVANLVQILQNKAKEFGVPLTAPEVVDGDHVVEFEGLYPTQLLFRMKKGDVVPLNNLPSLNGRFIGLTGKHGGGKTEALVTLAANLLLAQSGLPVFANRFRFNVKRVVALAFIPDRGVGSTIQQMLEKVENIMRGIEGVPGHEVVVLLDEIGTGTQAESGIEFGIRLLDKLASIGVSVIYSSQLTQIAKHAETHLGAMNFRFSRDHRIEPGIGEGGLNELLVESGLEDLLTIKS